MTVWPQRRAKAAQEKSTPRMKGPGRWAIQKSPHYGPSQPPHTVRHGERRFEVGVGGLDGSIHLYFTLTPGHSPQPGGSLRRIPQPVRAALPDPEENTEA